MTLLEQLKAATGPDRSIDIAIFRTLYNPDDYKPFWWWLGASLSHVPVDQINTVFQAKWDEYVRNNAPFFTTSVDAALTLIPEGWRVRRMQQTPDGTGWFVDLLQISSGWRPGENARTLPLAICLASIEARSLSTQN